MGWGDVLSDPKIWNLAGSALGGTGGTAINFLGSLIGYGDAVKKKADASSDYYKALAQQKQLAQLAAQVATQRAQTETALKNSILQQNANLGTTLQQAQTAMGAMPQFDPGTLQADYASEKANLMNDFTNLVKLTESQGRANQIERLGGAGSMVADNDRMNALISRYSPELAKIDSSAFDAAVAKSTGKMNLFNTSRSNTLNEIKNTLQPQITNDIQLLSQNGGMGDAISAGQENTKTGAGLVDYTADAAGDAGQTLSEQLAHLLATTYNPAKR